MKLAAPLTWLTFLSFESAIEQNLKKIPVRSFLLLVQKKMATDRCCSLT